jgi:sugar transferase (PEP-CTERM/EpsH1 system associated)
VKDLLYLSHRMPFPPDKGDKIRSWHLLKRLTENWRVHLGAFIDDKNDWQYVDRLNELCGDTRFVALSPTFAKLKALRGFVGHSSLTMPYYSSTEMHSWVAEVIRKRNPACIVVFSSSMAQYATPYIGPGRRVIVDFCDMDSDKWRQYSARFGGFRRWIYRREADRLQREEKDIADRCDAAILVSEDEARLFRRNTGVPAGKVLAIANGVDTEYFNPARNYLSPFSPSELAVVFIGAMDYWPNIDSVCWFAENVFTWIRSRYPQASFWIVGSKPAGPVLELRRIDGVTVTGRVPDVRPYLSHARCVVAPLRIARGVQNKVLEALAMGKPVIASESAVEGIKIGGSIGASICTSNEEWLSAVAAVLENDEILEIDSDARQQVTKNYSWESSARSLAHAVVGEYGTR